MADEYNGSRKPHASPTSIKPSCATLKRPNVPLMGKVTINEAAPVKARNSPYRRRYIVFQKNKPPMKSFQFAPVRYFSVNQSGNIS